MQRAPRRALDIRFTGSGSEYFRIWIVNLLLSLLTLGLYLPFAKARRLRYFHANTLIDGHALGFHGDPWKMFRGFLLLVVLAGLSVGLAQVSVLLSNLAFAVLVLLWPPLWRAGLRFRLTHTSWRGLRFGFAGDVAGAYRVFLPVGVPLLLLTLTPEEAGPLLAGLGALGVNLMLPWTIGLARRYQHGHYRFAQQQTRTWLAPYQVYGLSFRAGALGSVAIIVGAIGVAVVAGPSQAAGNWPVIAAAAMIYAAVYLWVSSAFIAGLQNLCWSRTATDSLRFRSELRTLDLAALTFKNWLLVIVTLSLYRPFAAVATARLRLQAMSVETSADVAAWLGDEAGRDAHAAGEFAGDFFGIDMGL